MQIQNIKYGSTKTYTHAQGLSACFRQWRATHSHCQYLHGYALQVELTFEAPELDERNWVVDFGGLKALKGWLEATFDHKTLVAKDDPKLPLFEVMDRENLLTMVVVDAVGCEAFAKMIFNWVNENIMPGFTHAGLRRVEVREHGGNSAYVEVI